MTRLSQAFWAVAALDALLLAVALAMTLNDSAGSHDGGREMGLFFFVMVPALVLALAALAFHFSGSSAVRVAALLVVLVPGAWWAKVQVENVLIDRQIAANQAGTAYFDDEALRRMAAAVVQRDLPTLASLGRTVDVNTPGRDGMTLLRLAVRQPDARAGDGAELPTVRALLALGAHADDAMPAAAQRADPALLQTLLAAGGNPNLQVSPGEPLVFGVMSTVTPRSFRLLAAHGLKLDSTSRGDPLPVQLTIYRRWDLLLIAMELGADMTRTRPDGRSVAGELAAQAEEMRQAGHDMPSELRQALSTLSTPASRNAP